MIRCAPKSWLLLLAAVGLPALTLAGCGTTRSSDTSRTATEQLLISDAIDRAVQTVDLDTLAGQTVYLDDSKLAEIVDRNYLISTLRQHLLANGCLLRDKREDAAFIVEARAGAIGTDRNDLLFGVPSMNVPQILPMQPTPAAIPEIPLAKRRDQRGIAKIAVFAYHRETGEPVWQSGIAHQESSANDVWILGAGPFQRGTIYEGTEFAGKAIKKDDDERDSLAESSSDIVKLDAEKVFSTPSELVARHQQSEQSAPAIAQESPHTPADKTPAAPAMPKPMAAATPTTTPASSPVKHAALATPSTDRLGSNNELPSSKQALFESTILEFSRPLSDFVSTGGAPPEMNQLSSSIYRRSMVEHVDNTAVSTLPPPQVDLSPSPSPPTASP